MLTTKDHQYENRPEGSKTSVHRQPSLSPPLLPVVVSRPSIGRLPKVLAISFLRWRRTFRGVSVSIVCPLLMNAMSSRLLVLPPPLVDRRQMAEEVDDGGGMAISGSSVVSGCLEPSRLSREAVLSGGSPTSFWPELRCEKILITPPPPTIPPPLPLPLTGFTSGLISWLVSSAGMSYAELSPGSDRGPFASEEISLAALHCSDVTVSSPSFKIGSSAADDPAVSRERKLTAADELSPVKTIWSNSSSSVWSARAHGVYRMLWSAARPPSVAVRLLTCIVRHLSQTWTLSWKVFIRSKRLNNTTRQCKLE